MTTRVFTIRNPIQKFLPFRDNKDMYKKRILPKDLPLQIVFTTIYLRESPAVITAQITNEKRILKGRNIIYIHLLADIPDS